LDNFEWPYLTTAHDLLSLYSAHRAVIFAIAQLSCYIDNQKAHCFKYFKFWQLLASLV